MRSTMLASALGALFLLGVANGQMYAKSPGGSIDAKALAKAEKEYVVAKKAYVRRPSPTTKHALVVGADRFALSSMYAESLDRKVKYKQALKLYREVLKLEPTNHEAKNNSDLIISIYHSLHRPVPN